MSAPSRASSTAWLRPWPRAPPVMTATLPASGVWSLVSVIAPPAEHVGPGTGAGCPGDPILRAQAGPGPGPEDLAIATVPVRVGLTKRRARPDRREQFGRQ